MAHSSYMSKILVIAFIFICSFGLVQAQEISVLINGVSSGELTLEPNQNVVVETELAENIYVQRIEVESSDKLLKQLIEQELVVFENEPRHNATINYDHALTLPDTLPGGSHEVTVTIFYSDASYIDTELTIAYIVNIPNGNNMVTTLINSFGQDVANEVISAIRPIQIKPLPREPTVEESRILFGEDDKPTYVLTNELTVEEELSDDDITRLQNIENSRLSEVMEYITKEDKPTITKELRVFEVTHSNGSTSFVSKIIIRVSHTESINNVEIVEEIPKVVAADVSEMALHARPEIIERDPIVKWQFDHIPEGQTAEFSYTVDKELETIESTTAAAGKEPSAFAKWIANLIKKIIGDDVEE